MIYMLEDEKDDILSKLFREAYPKEIADKFVYTNGSGNIEGALLNVMNNSNERVGIFLDTIPGNRDCTSVYYKLRAISDSYPDRVVVFPIVCSEYYIIKLLSSQGLMIKHSDVDICLNKLDFTTSEIYNNPETGKQCKNFEKFCKFVIKNYAVNCALNTPGRYHENLEYSFYYCKDCLCGDDGCYINHEYCSKASLKHKALKLLSMYRCVPGCTLAIQKESIDFNKALKISNELVDEFNAFSEYYKALNIRKDNGAKYRKLVYFNRR